MAKLLKTWVSGNFHKIKILTLATLLYLTLPITLSFLLLAQLLRKCATIVAKIGDKKVHKILSPQSSLLASDDLYGIPSHNVVALFVLNGNFIGVDHLRSVIYENVINKQKSVSSASGSSTQNLLSYSQLQQFPTCLYKYMFWKWDEEFNIQNHVRFHSSANRDENKIWSEADVLHLQGNLLRKSWIRKRSLWEMLVVPNYKGSTSNSSSSWDRELRTVILLRFHESLGDISSWFRIFLSNLCDCGSGERGHIFPNHLHHHPPIQPLQVTKDVEKDKTESHLPSLVVGNSHAMEGRGDWKCNIIQAIKFPFHFAEQTFLLDNDPMSLTNVVNKDCWSVEEKRLMKRDHFKIIDRFSIQHIKEIKALFGVSFTSVILAASTSAIRNALLSLGQSLSQTISIQVPIMAEQKQCPCEIEDKLCSYTGSPLRIQLPVGISSPKERLRHCHESYIKAKNGQQLHSRLKHLLGLLPVSCFKRGQRNLPSSSGTLLNLPGTVEELSFMECSIEDVVVASTRENGFTITFLSYAEFIRMSLVIDHRLIPAVREDVAKDFLKQFYSEMVLLGIESIV